MLPTLTVAMLDAARDRRADRAIAELDACRFSSVALLEFGDRARHVDLGLGVVERDLGGGVLGDQFGVARDVALGLLELRLGAGDHRLAPA